MTRRVPFGPALLVGALAIALALAPGVAVGHGGDGVHHHDGVGGMHDGWAGAWGLIWLLGMVLVLAAAVVATLVLVRRLDGRSGTARPPAEGDADPALAALRERYARGDVDEEEFRRRRELLRE